MSETNNSIPEFDFSYLQNITYLQLSICPVIVLYGMHLTYACALYVIFIILRQSSHLWLHSNTVQLPML